jgi:hypothetical protein
MEALDRRLPTRDVSEACAEMPHQALALETGPDARLNPGLCLFWSPLVFHCSPRSNRCLSFHFGALGREVGV